ncbi:glycosyltransferase [Lacisediminihabitans changchengi]|uniref:Uncharacterized protein n=1 Tax=Lacisediminihabitans changchengi TaxID=2787634 RepID=A0A934W5H3_9MICO|nr:glycosyltransferase [Lacisediminihabitans changchengi]MBK4348510.1 hypothetical protein [Lacisediminihabitans changchengi]
MDIDHVILTRFNLPTPGPESMVRAQDGWLRTRVVLFEKYCVPSVLSQSTRDFTWIIYFDPESPDWLKEIVERYSAEGAFVPVFRASVSNTELLDDIRRITGAHGTTLITTNLDNDDGLAVDFIERLQSAPRVTPSAALYLTHGLIKSPAGLFIRTDRHNAFCSVRETWDDPKTCWIDWHDLLPKHFAVQEIVGAPAWLQVVHGTNVSNRVHGSLVDATSFRASFPGLLDDVEPPHRAQLLRDRLIASPARAIATGTRLSGKRLIRAVLGKEGLNRVKGVVAGLRGGTR